MLKKSAVVIGLVLFLLGGIAFVYDDEIDWGDDIKSAIKKAGEAKKPVLIYFTCGMQNCWQCRQESKAWSDEDIAEAVNKFIPVEIDSKDEDNEEICKEYKVKKNTHSTFRFIRPDGTPLKNDEKLVKVDGPFVNQQQQPETKKITKKLKKILEDLGGDKKEEK